MSRCEKCGRGFIGATRRDWAHQVCFDCLPAAPALPVRRKCRHCIHDEHSGLCTGRNGGTGWPCPCFHSAGGTP